MSRRNYINTIVKVVIEEKDMRAIHENILGAVGRTPIVRLGKIGKGLKATLLAKVEYTNPGEA